MKKKFYPKEVRITDINQHTGVSAEQLLNHLKKVIYLSKSIQKMAMHLTRAEVEESINTAVVTLIQKMNEGIVPKYNYDDFKDYMFITLKNSLGRQFQRMETKSDMIIRQSKDFGEVVSEDFLTIDPYIAIENKIDNSLLKIKEINFALEKISKEDLSILTRVMHGERPRSVCRELDKANNYYHQIIQKIRKLVREQERKIKQKKEAREMKDKIDQATEILCPKTTKINEVTKQCFKKTSESKKQPKKPIGRPKGQKLSQETKDKIGHGNKNKKHSDEHKKKLSAANTGKKLTEEHKKKIAEGNKGKKVSQETRDKIAKTLRGRKHSEEHKEKLRQIHLFKKQLKDNYYKIY